MLTEGQRIGPIRLLACLGAGGMGEVWRARDTRLERELALKVLPADALTDQGARARLLREARTAARLNHPNICVIHEVGEAEGQVFFAMELVEGRPLNSILEAGALPVERALSYGAQVAEALAHAHGRGVVHRDLKSANVVVTPDGRAKVLDFGLAKRLAGRELADVTTRSQDSLTAPGAVVGTLAYMAPEQLRGEAADGRSDLWALGVVLHEMVGGQRPFVAQTGFALSAAILNEPPAPLPASVPSALQAVVARCLAKAKGERYQTAEEVRAALQALQLGDVIAGPQQQPGGPRGRRRSRAAAVVLGVAAALVLFAGKQPGSRKPCRGGTWRGPAGSCSADCSGHS